MAEYLVTTEELTSIADAIRMKSGGSSQLAFPSGFVSEIGNIPSGGLPGRLIAYETVIPTSDATNSSKISINLPIKSKYLIAVIADSTPETDQNLYWALLWMAPKLFNSITNISSILRPNGEIGTDQNMCAYNTSTGVLTLGGEWGYFKAGLPYHVYMFA